MRVDAHGCARGRELRRSRGSKALGGILPGRMRWTRQRLRTMNSNAIRLRAIRFANGADCIMMRFPLAEILL